MPVSQADLEGRDTPQGTSARETPGSRGWMKSRAAAASSGAVPASPRGSAGLSRPGPRRSPQSSGGGGGAFPAAVAGSSASPRVPTPFQVYPKAPPPPSHSSPGAAGRTPSPSLPAPPGVCGQGRWERS